MKCGLYVLPLIALLNFLTACSTSSVSQTVKVGKVDGKARIRVFAQNGIGAHLYLNSICKGGENSIAVAGPGNMSDTFSSFIGTIKNESIGIPETSSVDMMLKRSSFASKVYYKEYSINAGEPVTVDMVFVDPAGYRCGPIASQFIPESKADYEALLDLDFAKGLCKAEFHKISDDGTFVPLGVSPAKKCN